jgi:hypothetical protein
MSKIKLRGGVIQNGQYAKTMARNCDLKQFKTPAVTAGMKRQTTGALHPYLHGQAATDATREKNFDGKGNVPTHPGMTTTTVNDDRFRGSHDPQSGKTVFEEAGRLGRPTQN